MDKYHVFLSNRQQILRYILHDLSVFRTEPLLLTLGTRSVTHQWIGSQVTSLDTTSSLLA